MPFLLLVLLGVCCCGVAMREGCDDDYDDDSEIDYIASEGRRKKKPEPPVVPRATPHSVHVKHLITKRIKASTMGGTFRYFFDVRNHDPLPFKGEIKITLVSSASDISGAAVAEETFTATGLRLGTYVYLESSVAPAAAQMHGEYGLRIFRWSVSDGQEVSRGTGALTSAYEDISSWR